MIRRILSFAVVLSSTLLLAGCDNGKTKTDKEQVPARSEPVTAIPPAPEPYVPPPAYSPAPMEASIYIPPAPVPAPRPAAAAKPAASAGKTYTVQKGDTLTGIARKVYGNPAKFKDIAAANGIADPNKIKAGQVLILP